MIKLISGGFVEKDCKKLLLELKAEECHGGIYHMIHYRNLVYYLFIPNVPDVPNVPKVPKVRRPGKLKASLYKQQFGKKR